LQRVIIGVTNIGMMCRALLTWRMIGLSPKANHLSQPAQLLGLDGIVGPQDAVKKPAKAT